MSITCSQALSVDRSSLKEERLLKHNPEMRSWLHDKDYQEKKLYTKKLAKLLQGISNK